MEIMEYSCIKCGSPVKSLFKKYSDTVLKLTECDYCKYVADKYIECDTVIIMIDLILLRVMAYRHFLFNSDFKNYWKLSAILLVLETYSKWSLTKEMDEVGLEQNVTTGPQLSETDIYLDDFRFYKMILIVTAGTIGQVYLAYLLTRLYSCLNNKKSTSFSAIHKALTLSNSGFFLLLPSLFWDIHVHELHLAFVSFYITLSQLLSHNDKKSLLRNMWVWSDLGRGLMYPLRDIKDNSQKMYSGAGSASVCSNTPNFKDAIFKDTLGSQSQTTFRKHYQRKGKLFEEDVVVLQDIKDVAIFTCNIKALTLEFISYFHTKAMDTLLRSLIIYFQYYCQVPLKRFIHFICLLGLYKDFIFPTESRTFSALDIFMRGLKSGLSHPYTDEYSRMKRAFNNNDFPIEKELNRLLRTDTFNPIEHASLKSSMFNATPEETRILKGKACKKERSLLHRSPAIQEIILNDHDYRMLALGVTDTGLNDDRQTYLEVAYTAPEEMLEELGIGVGILGVRRKYLDTELKPKELSTTQRRVTIMKPIPEFIIPPRKGYGGSIISETLPKTRCKYHESEGSKTARKKQCKMWREYVRLMGQPPFSYTDALCCPSHVTLRTSVTPAYSKYG